MRQLFAFQRFSRAMAAVRIPVLLAVSLIASPLARTQADGAPQASSAPASSSPASSNPATPKNVQQDNAPNAAAAQKPESDQETLKVNVNVVGLFFNVKDKHGALIPNLT